MSLERAEWYPAAQCPSRRVYEMDLITAPCLAEKGVPFTALRV
jgi:hypothetical protein